MRILFTGANGFLAKELCLYFENDKYNTIYRTDRRTLDPSDYENVKLILEEVDVDVIVHTAVKGGKRNQKENIADFYTNMMMFQNLRRFSHKYKYLFNFGSGAEFDRQQNISLASEEDIFNNTPSDYYGMAKNLISRQISQGEDNIYNLRLFGCFGKFEEPQRLFRSSYDKLSNQKDAQISSDKYMDYFYAQDVGTVIEHIARNPGLNAPKDINLCYRQKYLLSEYAEMIKDLTKSNNGVIIDDEKGFSYTGCYRRLQKLDLDLKGIEKGVSECLKSWTKS